METHRRLEKESPIEKQAESTLRTSQTKYRTLYDLSSDAIMLLTPEEGFLSGNAATVALFGCKDEKDFTLPRPRRLVARISARRPPLDRKSPGDDGHRAAAGHPRLSVEAQTSGRDRVLLDRHADQDGTGGQAVPAGDGPRHQRAKADARGAAPAKGGCGSSPKTSATWFGPWTFPAASPT